MRHFSPDDFYRRPAMVMVRPIFDSTLSLKAKGLFSFFECAMDESKEALLDWDGEVESLPMFMLESEDEIRKALKELELHGYVQRDKDGSLWIDANPGKDVL